jgi:microcystin-dependent protein
MMSQYPIHYIADGIQNEFSFNFRLFNAEDLRIYLGEILQAPESYALLEFDNHGGIVRFNTAPENHMRITITQYANHQRQVYYPSTGELRSAILNLEGDHIYHLLQQQAQLLDVTVKLHPSYVGSISTFLPQPIANRALVWNHDANALVNSDVDVNDVIPQAISARDATLEAADNIQAIAPTIIAARDATLEAQILAEQARDEAQDIALQDPDTIKQHLGLGALAELDRLDASLIDNLVIPDNTPIGAVFWHSANSAPTGFLSCNGALISRISYADLFQVIGTTYGAGDGSTTFQLPDLRGEFIRGWDNGRGIDNGRVFASYQADAFKSHSHTTRSYNDNATHGTRIRSTSSSSGGGNTTSSSAGGSETRPRNIALLPIIKY